MIFKMYSNKSIFDQGNVKFLHDFFEKQKVKALKKLLMVILVISVSKVQNLSNFTKKVRIVVLKKGKIHYVQSSCSHFGLFAQKLLLKSVVMLWGKEGSTLVASTCLSPIRVSRRFWSRFKRQEFQIESLFLKFSYVHPPSSLISVLPTLSI